jgi:transcriptional regulator with XRE-family HTH domain
LSQGELGRRAGVGRSVVSRAERGVGALDLDALERLAAALDVPLAISIGRDLRQDDLETGHLAMQEQVLRFGRVAGFTRQFEMPTRPAEPWRSCDIGLGSARQRVAVDVECWNSFGDIGAATRSSNRKVAELAQIAVAYWGADARAVLVWVVRDTARNHALVARYPEVFASRFTGSSRAWVLALTKGGPVPDEPGLIWCDLSRGRLHPWRRRDPASSGS